MGRNAHVRNPCRLRSHQRLRRHPHLSRVNPRQAREFARATGVLAKTDRVDARVLAQMGAALDLPVTRPSSPARATLADFLRRHSAGHDDMRVKGKAPKTILIAVARQLLVILNAMIQKRQPLQVT